MHLHKTKLKIKFDIVLKSVNNLPPEHNGKNVFIEFKRGSSVRGSTQKAMVRDKTVIWEELLDFEICLYQHNKKKTFSSKKIEFTLKEFLGKKSTVIGECEIDLGKYGNANSYNFQSFPLKVKKDRSKSTSLMLNITSKWLKYNSKIVEKGTAKAGQDGLNVDGEDYFLRTDADGTDDSMDSEDETETFSRSESSNSNSSGGGNDMSEITSLDSVKDTDPVDVQNKKLKKLVKKLESENRKLKSASESNKEKAHDRAIENSNLKAENKALKKHLGKDALDAVKKESSKQVQQQQRGRSSTMVDADDSAALHAEMIRSLEIGFKKSKQDIELQAHWLSTCCLLYDTLERQSDDVEDKEDIMRNGIPLKHKDLDSNLPIEIALHQLEVLIFDIYTLMLKNAYSKLDNTLIPFVLEQKALILGTPSADANRGKDRNQSSVQVLHDYFQSMRNCRVFPSIIQQFFSQIFYYVNARIMNYLLKRRDLCTCGMGFQLKFTVSLLEDYALSSNRKELLLPVIENINHLKEVANLLVIDKTMFGNDDTIFKRIFTTLNIVQIRQILSMFTADQYYKSTVPPGVLRKLDALSQQAGMVKAEIDTTTLLAFKPYTNASSK